MPGSLSIETEAQQVCSSPLDSATPPSPSDLQIVHSEEPATIGPHNEESDSPFTLLSPLRKAIETAATSLCEDEMSSTDTAVSLSPIFDTCSMKAPSDASITEDEKEIKEAPKEPDPSPAAIDVAAKEEVAEIAPSPPRTLTTKRSLWNIIRGASLSVGPVAAAITSPIKDSAATSSEPDKPEEKVEAPALQQPKAPTDSNLPVLNKRRSFAAFPTLNWSKSSRRHTLTATNGGAEASEISPISGAERSLDGSIHLPKRNVDEAKVAEDAIRFADARHVIKTEQDIEVIRQLAARLESGWREKQHELATMRQHLEESQLHHHDIRDENRHLRSQLASMSEQIVARDHDFEELQKVAVEQSKKERAIWEVEKAQAIHEVEEKVKELQEEMVLLKEKIQRRRSHLIVDESDDEESDYRDAVLFSATTSTTTSIDDELQYQQSTSTAPFTTPTTPTIHGASNWQAHYPTLGVDPLMERLSTVQARQIAA